MSCSHIDASQTKRPRHGSLELGVLQASRRGRGNVWRRVGRKIRTSRSYQSSGRRASGRCRQRCRRSSNRARPNRECPALTVRAERVIHVGQVETVDDQRVVAVGHRRGQLDVGSVTGPVQCVRSGRRLIPEMFAGARRSSSNSKVWAQKRRFANSAHDANSRGPTMRHFRVGVAPNHERGFGLRSFNGLAEGV